MNVVASRAVRLDSSFLLLGNADIVSVVANIDNVALVVGGVFVEVAVLLLLHSALPAPYVFEVLELATIHLCFIIIVFQLHHN